MSRCPLCSHQLSKCLIQSDLAIVMCTELNCSYPFNEGDITSKLIHVSEGQLDQITREKVMRIQGLSGVDKVFGKS